ncbi:MAG: sulfotransferase [Thermodesulfobacteriota bacterium]
MKKIALLTYLSRSGSTFLSSSLDKHPAFRVSIETDILQYLIEIPEHQLPDIQMIYRKLGQKSLTLQRILDKEIFESCHQKLDHVSYYSVASCMLQSHFKDAADVFIVKNRGGAWHLFRLAECIPELKFIHIVRDGRAVLNSQYNTDRVYRKGKMAADPLLPAMTWKKWVGFVERFKEYYPDRIIEVRYEDLVADHETQLARVQKFLLGSEMLPNITDRDSDGYKERIPAKELSLHANVGKKPMGMNIEKWKSSLSKRDIVAYELIAEKALRNRGYEPLYNNKEKNKFLKDPLFLLYIFLCIVKMLGRKAENFKYRILQRFGLSALDS